MLLSTHDLCMKNTEIFKFIKHQLSFNQRRILFYINLTKFEEKPFQTNVSLTCLFSKVEEGKITKLPNDFSKISNLHGDIAFGTGAQKICKKGC